MIVISSPLAVNRQRKAQAASSVASRLRQERSAAFVAHRAFSLTEEFTVRPDTRQLLLLLDKLSVAYTTIESRQHPLHPQSISPWPTSRNRLSLSTPSPSRPRAVMPLLIQLPPPALVRLLLSSTIPTTSTSSTLLPTLGPSGSPSPQVERYPAVNHTQQWAAF